MKPLRLLLCLAAWPGTAFATTPAAQLAASCAACHRLGAADASVAPAFGRDAQRIEQAMLAYRTDTHRSQIMHVVANALSPDEIAAVAQYLAAPQ